ncbi:polyprenyl synthetase family protein [Rhodovulum marinum]|uniref:Geranylgeranyl diphosphate synthase n=1 Tax=Rhodovulum marinum TaxID=320662 RepID=A0A4R2PYD3_9RHOB|nr:farnesyl diphosphate synthase [Rhodovulum marinum]TCP40198.1 farnesyl-diphosphate synthase [Rhodovulum marinum]
MFQSQLQDAAGLIEARLMEALADAADQPVTHAMRYAVAGGKRLRGFLVIEGAALYGVPADHAVHAAAAIEAVHAYSLVHDDMPCMDDDDLRRGQPTVHVKWDDGTALLVGDALQTLAFDLLADPACHPDPGVRIDLVASLARASGIDGMVLGQAQDIAAETAGRPLTLAEITELQANKTGALIRWSAEAGARLGRADIAPLSSYATALGLAFQIADDILDVEGDAEKTGKRVQKDADAGKATFVSLLGLDGAKARAHALVDEACEALAPFGARADILRETARFVIARET